MTVLLAWGMLAIMSALVFMVRAVWRWMRCPVACAPTCCGGSEAPTVPPAEFPIAVARVVTRDRVVRKMLRWNP